MHQVDLTSKLPYRPTDYAVSQSLRTTINELPTVEEFNSADLGPDTQLFEQADIECSHIRTDSSLPLDPEFEEDGVIHRSRRRQR